MQEIDTTEGSSDARVNLMAGTRNLHESVAANMREDVTLAQLDESQLSIVAVCEEV